MWTVVSCPDIVWVVQIDLRVTLAQIDLSLDMNPALDKVRSILQQIG